MSENIIFWHFGLRWLIFRPIKSHTCSIGLMSGDIAGHGIVWTASCCKKCCAIRALCGLALSSMNIGRNPKCQNIDELRTAILQEWQQFPQERLRRLVRSMTRRVTELHNKRGGYTRYWFLCLTHTLYHPERRDYDVAKMGFKTGAGKT
jgi:hypothetical protein